MSLKPGSLIAGVFLLVGLALLGIAGVVGWKQNAVLHWPTVPATVLSSRVTETGQGYQYEIRLRYDRDGPHETTYTSSVTSSSPGVMRQEADRFPEGSTRDVRVDPADPTDIRPDAQASLLYFLAPLVLGSLGLVFAAIGAVALLMGTRPPREWSVGRMRSTVRRVGFVFTTLGVLGILGAAAMGWSQVGELRRWPSVEAQVVASEVQPWRRNTAGQRTSLWVPRVTFHYVVRDTEYTSAGSAHVSVSGRQAAQRTANRFPPGSRHTVRYLPDDPNVVRWDMGYNFSYFFLPLVIGLVSVATTVMGVGVAMLGGRVGAGLGESVIVPRPRPAP
jgi:hypothetical protein